MELPLVIAVGILFAVGMYLLLQRSAYKLAVGLLLFSHASILTVFVMGRLQRGRVPIVDGESDASALADPLVQALILTAIVIGFAVAAFLVTLVVRTHREIGSDDTDDMRRLKG